MIEAVRARSTAAVFRGVASFVAIAVAAAAAALLFVAPAQAQDAASYPTRPIKIIVPFGAGSQMDIVARLVGGKLSDSLGKPVIVENQPGASGNIGSEIVAKAPPDGYTLLVTGSLITLLPSTLGARAVDPVAAFAPITKLAEPPILIVANPALGVSTLPELIAKARAQPGKIAYATAGIGTVQHLTALTLSKKAGIDMLHIPYANSGQALKDVLQGEVPVYFTFLGPIDTYLKNGQLKALAVESNHRMRAWPEIPTVAELGYEEAVADPWNGVLAPAGTPPAIIELLYRELARIVVEPDVREVFIKMGMEPLAPTPAEFSAEIRRSVQRWPPIAREAGIRPD
ncbi:MAG TPA: tripartite tricarboxylate transporter substrate binding protein [Casimicrobiaceae bacterium]|nr:tripartite tricarboxylate transporter substrate binding protein [Casimicrobiaceae bacterium]